MDNNEENNYESDDLYETNETEENIVSTTDEPNNDIDPNPNSVPPKKNANGKYKSKTREQVDETLDSAGSEILQKKFGIPKPLADKAIKTGGGKFSPNNLPANKYIKNKGRNFIANEIDRRNGNTEEQNVSDDLQNPQNQQNQEEQNNTNNQNNKNFLKGQANAKVKKKVGSFFSKNPYVAIGILLGVLFLVLPILIIFFYDNPENEEVNPNSTESVDCSSIDYNKTPLSRSDFIARVEEYYANKPNTTQVNKFRDNAGSIYDLGEKYNINPELIYIIAVKEQGTSKECSYCNRCNNWYGYGVYNGASSGKYCWSTFLEGVEYMYGYFQRKGTFDNLIQVYSSVGKYLTNTNNGGDGGCYYLKLPEVFGPNYSRCNSSYKCSSPNGGPGCVLTTEAEQQAYIDYQRNVIYPQHRKNIFKLSADACNVSGGVDGSTEGATFLNESISNFLANNNTSIEEFNNKVIEQGCKHIGTGEGVAYVASTAVSELAKYGKKFHYTWGGMHSSAPSNYGVPANWGSVGPDCSGFVSWALYNAGFTWKSLGATDWGKSGEVVELGDNRVRIGDFIVTPGNRGYNHIVIITAIHNEEGYYSVVEASSSKNGVIFNKVKFSDTNKRKAVLMSNYYSTAARSEAFNSMCLGLGINGG